MKGLLQKRGSNDPEGYVAGKDSLSFYDDVEELVTFWPENVAVEYV